MELLKKFKQYVHTENLFHSHDRLLLAVSGGVDSVALCELCKQAGYNFAIAHCNFRLRGEESSRDETFVKNLAEKYGADFFIKTFDTDLYATEKKQSIEEAARELRYQWFHELIGQPHDPPIRYVLTGHHADDNIETVVMNFFRGTGISGLRGIMPKHGKIVRPLLFARRSELEEFITINRLQFVTDHTNLQNDYTRNYFRNKIMPLVNQSFPEASSNVLKNITRFKETEILYSQSVELHKKKLLEHKGNEVHIPVLKLLKSTPLTTIMYEIIKPYGFTAHQTEDATSLLKSETGKYIQSASHRILKNRNWLIISPRQTIEAGNILFEAGDTDIQFTGGAIKVRSIDILNHSLSTDNKVAALDAAEIRFPLLLRKWKQGDYFYPLGMQKKKKLSRFFIDNKLSLVQKENTWVIEMDKKILWIVGMRIDDRFKITHITKQILIFTISQNEDG